MRRGVLVALGDAGDHCASRAIAGTIWVRGRIGKSPAQALKRATLLLEQAPPELSTFLECGIHEMPVLRMLLPSLDRLAGTQVAANSSFHAKRYLGCIGVDGRGEVLVLT
jgi:formylmethanofuran dehydrogenase subunit C